MKTSKGGKPAPKTMRICITITAQAKACLEALLELGLYGSSISDVAERLICESLHADTKRLREALLAKNQNRTEAA